VLHQCDILFPLEINMEFKSNTVTDDSTDRAITIDHSCNEQEYPENTDVQNVRSC
jgi:hypothetical protein